MKTSAHLNHGNGFSLKILIHLQMQFVFIVCNEIHLIKSCKHIPITEGSKSFPKHTGVQIFEHTLLTTNAY